MTGSPAMRATARGPATSRFRWRGFDASGRRRRGTIDALDVRAALERLRRERIVALEIIEVHAHRHPRVPDVDLTHATRHLAMLLRTGLSLQPALTLVAEYARTPLKQVLWAVTRDIMQGSTLVNALERHASVFPTAYRRLVELAEQTGSLDAILTRLADAREHAAAQRARLRNALLYPALVVAFALGICTVLLIWVIPIFEQVFNGLGAQLPRPTRIVVAISRYMLAHGLSILATACASAACCLFAWQRSPTLRQRIDAMMLRLPIAGPILHRLAIARWSHALGMALDAGIALADGFGTVDGITGNAAVDAATRKIAAHVRVGASLADAMQASVCFPPDVVAAVALAEQTGTLGTMLADIGAWNEKIVTQRVGLLSQLAEPLIIIGPGALIAALVIAMYLPIIRMGSLV